MSGVEDTTAYGKIGLKHGMVLNGDTQTLKNSMMSTRVHGMMQTGVGGLLEVEVPTGLTVVKSGEITPRTFTLIMIRLEKT